MQSTTLFDEPPCNKKKQKSLKFVDKYVVQHKISKDIKIILREKPNQIHEIDEAESKDKEKNLF